mmetsp:Transcript_22802/g.31752  ORF Transcript_22802/g.31752 Transcript_22802/m.31752 type:complete len:477 (+) Transcript_22802:89-1519(+)
MLIWILYAILLIILHTIFLNWKINKLFKGTPGPLVIPILGNFHNLDVFYLDSFDRLSKKYGPVFRLMFGGNPCAVISHPELIREAFVRKYTKYSNRPFTESLKHIYMLKDPAECGIAFSQYGKDYIHKKQIFIQKMLKKSLVQKIEESIDSEIQRASEHIRNNNEFVVKEVTNQIAFNVIALLSMSQRIGDTTETPVKRLQEVGELASVIMGVPMLGDYIPWMQIFETKKRREFYDLLDQRNEIMRGILAQRKKVFDPNHPRDILDEFLLESMDDDAVIMALLEIFFGGTETSYVFLTWAIHALAEYPEIQEKLHNDIMKGSDAYLEAVVHETHRRFTIAPTFIPHVLAEDDTLGNCFLPKGTIVFANWWGVAHSPELWKDPYSFRPERWLEMTESQKSETAKIFFPFSLGPRQCPGMNLAELETRKVLKSLVKEFKFSWGPAAKKMSFKERWEVCVALVSAPKAVGLTCIAEPRV